MVTLYHWLTWLLPFRWLAGGTWYKVRVEERKEQLPLSEPWRGPQYFTERRTLWVRELVPAEEILEAEEW